MDGNTKSTWLRALARGAGVCSAADLNARGRWVEITRRVPKSQCPCMLVKEYDYKYLGDRLGDAVLGPLAEVAAGISVSDGLCTVCCLCYS